jgi:hypothetical protein
MTGKEFLRAVSNGEKDLLGIVLKLLEDLSAGYCVVGGLAVNAYAEPVVSLDLDIVVATPAVGALCRAAEGAGLAVEKFTHSVNMSARGSDLRIQVQTDSRYQAFIQRARMKTVLGYAMRVAAIEDVVQGKLWAYSDATRRGSKRQKDLADIMRLVETHPSLAAKLPDEVRNQLS